MLISSLLFAGIYFYPYGSNSLDVHENRFFIAGIILAGIYFIFSSIKGIR